MSSHFTSTNTSSNNKTNAEQSVNVHPLIIKLLHQRGFDYQGIHDFLSWDLKSIPDLSKMKDLNKASLRIINAIDNNEKIGIYGDYDVDGTTSCALLYHFFKMLNKEVTIYQPSRFSEGYGLHLSSIDNALNDQVTLLITVDCGISNIEAADYAKGKLDLIITDHHQDAREKIPDAYAVINPNRRDEPKSELQKLAGVGVAFALANSVRKELIQLEQNPPSLYPLLQFVAIGTICDIADLNNLNLRLVRHGLKQIPKTQYKGILSFLTSHEQDFNFLPSEKISFLIGPMINSKGRLEHPEISLKLLTTDKEEDVLNYYQVLIACNTERKEIQKKIFDEAKKIVIDDLKDDEMYINILYQPHWHEGVIGIVASRLVETFKVPAIIFTNSEEENIIKASARTAGCLNIFEELQKNKELFLKFGGHASAAGLSMKKEHLSLLKQAMIKNLKLIPEIQRTKREDYDLELSFNDITLDFIEALNLLEPFGQGNRSPIFKMSDARLEQYQILKDHHVKWNLSSKKKQPGIKKFLQAISFNYIGKWDAISPDAIMGAQENQNVSFFFTLGINHFNQKRYIQLNIQHVKLDLI